MALLQKNVMSLLSLAYYHWLLSLAIITGYYHLLPRHDEQGAKECPQSASSLLRATHSSGVREAHIH
jgi:triphosphoribosyl-dephospho-CoA synthetase